MWYDTRMKKLLVVTLLVLVPVVASRLHSSTGYVSDAKLVRDRVWIDHLPKNDRDTFNAFAVLTQESVGVFQATSAWRGNFELFRYEGQGDEFRVVFPQTGDREKLKLRARRCDERGMDFCLDIDGGSRGVKRYYSREGWEIGRVEDVGSSVGRLMHR